MPIVNFQKHKKRKPWRYFAISGILVGVVSSLQAQVLTSAQIDSVSERVLKTFRVPGIAVAVVKDGKIIHAKGYGVRSLATGQKTDENTLFGIASNSKAFTVAALGMLMDEGKLKWDDKVIDYIPEFRLYNPYVTEEFTIRDLLTHRSGLGLGAGDLMFWPDSTDFTVKDIIHNLRFLKSVSPFRTKYDYDNLLYIVAGEVVARVSGMSWQDFIEKRIMLPLGMTQSAASFSRLKDKSDVIDAHAPVNGKIQVIGRDFTHTADAAGGINSNLTDMCKWVIMQMNNGRYSTDPDSRLFSEKVHAEMWTPQTIIPIYGTNSYNTHYASYGLGWVLVDVKGYKQASHTGGLAGIVTQVTLIPELKLGILVFTNQQSGAAFTSITNAIKDGYLGVKGIDRIKQNYDNEKAADSEATKIKEQVEHDIAMKKGAVTPDLNAFAGTYTDKWFGDVTIVLKNQVLWFEAKRSPKLRGQMTYFNGSTFIVRWLDRSLDADAYVIFRIDNTGTASGITMKAISPSTDFSFDFQDLDLEKAGTKK